MTVRQLHITGGTEGGWVLLELDHPLTEQQLAEVLREMASRCADDPNHDVFTLFHVLAQEYEIDLDLDQRIQVARVVLRGLGTEVAAATSDPLSQLHTWHRANRLAVRNPLGPACAAASENLLTPLEGSDQ